MNSKKNKKLVEENKCAYVCTFSNGKQKSYTFKTAFTYTNKHFCEKQYQQNERFHFRFYWLDIG